MPDQWSRHGRKHERVSKIVRARGEACIICRQPIDYALKYPNPRSFSVQHMKSRAARPDLMWDPANCRAAHLECNQSLGTDETITDWDTSQAW